MSFSTMATGMDYESPYKADSPFSYEVEEGELSSGSGRSSPGTVRDNASDSGTQTDDQMGNINETVTTMRVHLDNTPENTQTPQEIARKIKTKFYKLKQNEDRRNLQSFNTTNTSEQGTNTNIHGSAHSRIDNNQIRSTTESYTSTPLPNYPPPVRPPPPSDYITEHPRTQTHVQQRLFTNTANSRPNNLRFPYAVTPRSTNSKSFFHQSTNEQTPTATVMETILFQDKDPRTLNSPHSSNYNPLLSYRNRANMPFDSREYNFFMSALHNLKDRVSEYFPPLPPENTNTVKRSTKNLGRDKLHQTMYPKLKHFYSLTERFLYDYDYELKIPITCNFDLLVAKASQDLSAYSIYDHQIFQLGFNFLHPTPKDVQNNNYRVHETKLIHNLIYYTFLRDKNDNTSRSYIHINDQLTSPYFLNYGYRLKWELHWAHLETLTQSKTIISSNRKMHRSGLSWYRSKLWNLARNIMFITSKEL